MAKDKDYQKLIHTGQWLRLRKDVLSVHPLCQRCASEGRITAATEVHHARPVEEAITYGDKRQRMYDPSNLLALCHDCHVKVHTELGRSGKEATKKRNEKQVADVVHRFFGDDDQDGAGFFKGRLSL